MQNNDPLRIFTRSEIDKLSSDTLLKYRKEKLLLFQMTEKYTVRLNGHDVDKNTVMSIFSDLERTLEDRLFQFKVPEIQEFLSSKDLAKFHLLLKVDFYSMSPSNKASIIDAICKKINNQLAKDIIGRKIGPVNIGKIIGFVDKHLSADTNVAYSRVYTELNDYVNGFAEKYEQPFEEKHLNSTKVFPEIERILKNKFYESLAALPSLFEPIKMSFAKWCHSNVLQTAFDRTTEFRRFKKGTLSALREAMYIAANYYHPKHHRDNARMITTYLNQSNKNTASSSSGGNGCGGIGIVIGIILFLFKFAILFNKCSDNSRSSGYGYNTPRYGSPRASQKDQEAYDMIQDMVRQRERKARENRNNTSSKTSGSSTTITKSSRPQVEEEALPPPLSEIYPRGGGSVQSVKVVKDYAGTNKLSLNAKVKRIEHKEDVVEVYFSCDALPMYHQRYSALVPDEVKEKYAGKVQNAVFVFEPRGLKKASTHVSLRIDLKSKSKYPATSFGFVKKVTEQAKKMHVKKIKTADFNFKGYIQKYKIGETKSTQKTNFKIKYDKSLQQYSYSESGRAFRLIDLLVVETAEANTVSQNDFGVTRYASLVNNIKIIQDKYLRQASIYTIPNGSYCFNTGSNSKQDMFVKEGILKMYITSKGDGNTYIELAMEKSHVNYVVGEDGYIKTVQQVTYDRSTRTIERILMSR